MNDFLVDASGNNYSRTASLNNNFLLTSDNTYAYINSKGVVKKYDSVADYTNMYGKNGCGASKINVSSRLDSLALPIGKNMKSGQTCGKENTYVKYDFPAKRVPEINRWLTDVSGRAAGTLPYPSLLTDMTKVGQAGYIDIDTTYHPITPTFTNTYGGGITTYIAGTAATTSSCAASSVTMKYGDKIILLSGNNYLKKQSSNKLGTGTSPTEIFILPSNPLQVLGSDVNYGDSVYFSLTDSLTTCGTTCSVGGVTFLNEFILGNPANKTAITISSANSVVKPIGTPIKLKDNVFLDATVYMNQMKENDVLTNNSTGRKSATENGNTAYLTYSSGRIQVRVNNGPFVTINSGRPNITGGSVVFTNGKLVIKNSSGVIRQTFPSTPSALSGRTPYKLYICSSGLVVVIDSSNSVQWKTSEQLEDDFEYDGVIVYGNMINNTFMFSTTPGLPTNIFSFSKNVYGRTNICDVTSLQKQCVDTNGCTGFILSPADNTWSKMMTTSTADDYTISKTDNFAFLRNMESGILDNTCPSTKVLTTLPPAVINGYPVGKEMTNTGRNQCNIFNALNLSEYEKRINEAKTNINNFNKVDVSGSIHNLEKYYASIQNNDSEYANMYTLFTDYETDNSKTRTQLLKDSDVVYSQEKTIAFIWGIVSVSMLMIILFRPRLNTSV